MLTASGQVSRPFIASLSVPADRIDLLRKAFEETVQDAEFVTDARRLRMPVTPKSAGQALRTVEESKPPRTTIVQAARKIAGQ